VLMWAQFLSMPFLTKSRRTQKRLVRHHDKHAPCLPGLWAPACGLILFSASGSIFWLDDYGIGIVIGIPESSIFANGRHLRSK